MMGEIPGFSNGIDIIAIQKSWTLSDFGMRLRPEGNPIKEIQS